MTELPRLNGVIKALEAGGTAFATFASAEIENAVSLATSGYDAVIFEMEHNPFDVKGLRDSLQFLMNRQQIVDGGTLAPTVTPLVRIPPNGGEMNQWLAKQVLDLGVYGVVWPHVSTVEEARNAVAACRYPRPADRPYLEPRGQRGDAPVAAARYWGIGGQDYYRVADVWPLNPQGEILVTIMCEEVRAIENLPKMLKEVPGIGVVLIGEGDLSQDLGHPRDYDHPVVVDAMKRIREACAEAGVVCGHPHGGTDNMEMLVEHGYRFIVAAPTRTYAALKDGRERTASS
ncbi:MAG: aldolase [Chloroflexi bacterium]|nr:aldolase [Chloroflexota bacterium]MCH7654386.1 aldolase [Chloroflexota bacterium]